MSRKRKKRSSSPYSRSQGSILADEHVQSTSEKKLNPTARNLLLTDLVILALASIGERSAILSPTVSTVITILGLILLLAALWYQFGGGGRRGGKPLS